ncbi:uncharacterized protein LOC116658127 [Camelus ferus]|uniref:Uncharacterized protein LOC116658127 n=1 Tax=Camelus ferus TaxID=419612 RepID=A0A8B8RLQ5_CAMFR|nr:uncharacterized protein LOC116658127 [Camelus ferus]
MDCSAHSSRHVSCPVKEAQVMKKEWQSAGSHFWAAGLGSPGEGRGRPAIRGLEKKRRAREVWAGSVDTRVGRSRARARLGSLQISGAGGKRLESLTRLPAQQKGKRKEKLFFFFFFLVCFNFSCSPQCGSGRGQGTSHLPSLRCAVSRASFFGHAHPPLGARSAASSVHGRRSHSRARAAAPAPRISARGAAVSGGGADLRGPTQAWGPALGWTEPAPGESPLPEPAAPSRRFRSRGYCDADTEAWAEMRRARPKVVTAPGGPG